jgi:hypothetical protein
LGVPGRPKCAAMRAPAINVLVAREVIWGPASMYHQWREARRLSSEEIARGPHG